MHNVVLLIDDSELDKSIYTRFLQSTKGQDEYRVLTLEDPEQIPQIFKSVNIDCVLLDYKLENNKNGLELIHAIKQYSPYSGILFLTGFGDETIASKAFKLGADDYLNKSDLSQSRLEITVKNIIEKKQNQLAQAKTNRELNLLRKAIENSQSLMMVCEPEVGLFITFNQQVCRFLGVSELAIKSHSFMSFTDYFNSPAEWRKFVAELQKKKVMQIEANLINLDKEKVPFEIDCNYSRIDNKDYLLFSGTDISRLTKIQNELQTLVIKDPLTQLLNRRGLIASYEKTLQVATRENYAFAFAIFDLDNFKKINDIHGHQAGDTVLTQFSDLLAKKFKRALDIVSRVGGEEFIVIVTDKDKASIRQLFNDVIKTSPTVTTPSTTASCGWVCVQGNSQIKNYDRLYALADKALYQAKENGRNQSVEAT